MQQKTNTCLTFIILLSVTINYTSLAAREATPGH